MDTVTIKIDKKVKQAAQKQAKKEGVSMPRLLASRITTFFDFSEPKERLNAKTRKMLIKEMKEIRQGKDLSPMFSNAKDAIAYLKNL